MSEANKTQVGGNHYRAEIQHWDFILDNFGPGYLIGCATKYLARWRKKNGLEDLEKARHYTVKLLEAHRQGRAPAPTSLIPVKPADFATANDLTELETCAITALVGWADERGLMSAVELIDLLIEEASK